MRKWQILLAVPVFFSACAFAVDRREEAALRGRCHVPEYASLKQFKKFSWKSDSDAPDGVGLAARYRMRPEDVSKFEAFMKGDGWLELAAPDSVPPQFRNTEAAVPARYVYFRRQQGVVLSVYNQESRELLAVVRSF